MNLSLSEHSPPPKTPKHLVESIILFESVPTKETLFVNIGDSPSAEVSLMRWSWCWLDNGAVSFGHLRTVVSPSRVGPKGAVATALHHTSELSLELL